MTRGRKRVLWALGVGVTFLLVLALTAFVVLQSHWFYERVRGRMIETVETATGGRVEIGSFRFDWRQLRAEVDSLTLHGTEPADKPPLLHAESVAVGLKIISILKRDVDISYLDVIGPQVYLIVGPDGKTNVPEPKIQKKAGKPGLQSILDLAIGHFSVQRGQFELASNGKTPFSASGNNLNAHFLYDRTGPRYKGDISIQPLHIEAGSYRLLPVGVATSLTLEANRVTVNSARLVSGASTVTLSGAIENLAAPRGRCNSMPASRSRRPLRSCAYPNCTTAPCDCAATPVGRMWPTSSLPAPSTALTSPTATRPSGSRAFGPMEHSRPTSKAWM